MLRACNMAGMRTRGAKTGESYLILELYFLVQNEHTRAVESKQQRPAWSSAHYGSPCISHRRAQRPRPRVSGGTMCVPGSQKERTVSCVSPECSGCRRTQARISFQIPSCSALTILFSNLFPCYYFIPKHLQRT